MNHYTYLIKHKTKNLKYIGVRSCKCPPSEDISYWGSSKHLPKDVSTTHKKRILKIFSSRKEALEHEISLHRKYKVATNPLFYNRANQTSVGFDTSGTKLVFTEEHKQKISSTLKGMKKSEQHKKAMSESNKRLASLPGYKNPRKGIVMSDSQKAKISEAKRKAGTSKGCNNNRFAPWYVTIGNTTHLYYHVTKDDQSILDGFPRHTYRDLYKKSQGKKAIAKGKHKGKIVGNIPT